MATNQGGEELELDGVQCTSDDAALSKLSACTKGYFEDEFMQIFVYGKSGSGMGGWKDTIESGKVKEAKRSPLINRGYFARVSARDMVISKFLETCRSRNMKCQIVSLGAGSDTTFFRLRKQGREPDLYVELDLPGVILRKMKIIAREAVLRDSLGATQEQMKNGHDSDHGFVLKSEKYVLATADLRNIAELDRVVKQVCGVDASLPTLFISECVLVYLDPEDSSRVISWASANFEHGAFTVYEQIRPNDAFGQMMMQNLERRGCPLLGLRNHQSPEAQIERFTKLGWTTVECLDMNDIYYKCLDKDMVRRAEKLEIFDEFEEWHMMQAHYCVVLARKGSILQEGVKLLPAS